MKSSKPKFQDERITQLSQKIFSEIGQILIPLLAIISTVKTFIFHSGMNVEGILFLLAIFYCSIRSWSLKLALPTSTQTKKSERRFIFLFTLILVGLFSIYHYVTYRKHYTGVFDIHFLASIGIFALSMLFLLFISLKFSQYINHKQLERLDKEIEE